MPRYEWEEMRLILDDITTLPTLPTIMVNAITIAFDPDSDMDDLFKLLRNDPAITVQILRVANSSRYSPTKEIDSLKTAMVILGMDEVVSIVTAVSMADTLQMMEPTESFDLHEFWMHSVMVGEIALGLQAHVKVRKECELFTAGLLHDIGSLLMATHLREDYQMARETATASHRPLHLVEQELLGFDHARIGEYLAQRWNLPERLQESIRYHHEPEKFASEHIDTALVFLADRLAHIHEVGAKEWNGSTEGGHDPGYAVVVDLWSKVGKTPFDQLNDVAHGIIENAKEKVQLMLF